MTACLQKLRGGSTARAFAAWAAWVAEQQALRQKMAHCVAVLGKRTLGSAFRTWKVRFRVQNLGLDDVESACGKQCVMQRSVRL